VGTYDVFVQRTLFGHNIKRFTQATDAERKAVFDELLKLGIYSEAREKVKVRMSKEDSLLKTVKENFNLTKVDLSWNKELHSKEKKEYNRALREYKESKTALKQKINLLTTKISGIEISLGDLYHGLELSRASIKSLDIAYEECEKELKNYYSVMQDVGRAVSHVESFSSRILKFESGLAEVCIECEQEIPHEHKNKQLELYKRKYNAAKKDLRSFKLELARLNDIKSGQDDIEADRQDVQKKIAAFEAQHKALTGELLERRDELVDLKLHKVVRPTKDDIVSRRKIINEVKEKLDDLSKEELEIKQRLEDLKFWYDGFGPGGIKSFLLDSILPILNSKVSEYASALFGADTQIEFDTQTETASGNKREKFDVRISTEGGEGYHLASGGERRRIDFCVALALKSLIPESTNVMVCEEPFESVDDAGREEFVDLLKEYSLKNQCCVYVITHITGMKALFDKTITVERKDGVSRILQ
jgi:DNA repair exonuclease SbcCD ATPase subunit